mgnify:CR=1 FL=1
MALTWACTGVIATWYPYVDDTMRTMVADGVKRALVLATSATSSYSGCRQYRENLTDAQAELGPSAPLLHKLRHYFDHPGFVAANADRVRAALTELPRDRREAARLVFTAHSHPGGDERLVRTIGRFVSSTSTARRRAWLPKRCVSPRAEFDLVWQSLVWSVPCAMAATRYQRSPANAGRAGNRGGRRQPDGLRVGPSRGALGLSTPKARETAARAGTALRAGGDRWHSSCISWPWCGSWWRRSCPSAPASARLAGASVG